MRRQLGCLFLIGVLLCVGIPAGLIVYLGALGSVEDLATAVSSAADPGEHARVGDPAPAFRLASLDGSIVELAALKGKPVIINFWATWCGPCQNEMPAIEEAHKKYGSSVRFLAINVEEAAGQADGFVKARKLTFQVLLDSQGSVSKTYRVRALPTTFFVDNDGKLIEQYTGEMNRSVIDRRVRNLTED